MCFSKAVSRVEGERLTAVIGVQRVGCHERYLGLPSFVGRNKFELFDEIKDRIWNRFKGWRSKLLSVGGKKKLCKAKEESGLGFRNLSMVNKAMLAKQGWRLKKNSYALAAKVLQGRRCPCYSLRSQQAVPEELILYAGITVRMKSSQNGYHKMNTDAALQVRVQRVGLGLVVRDCLGEVMAASGQRLEAGYAPRVAKAATVLRRIEFVKGTGLLSAIVKTDALGVVELVNGSSSISADIDMIIQDIKDIMGNARIGPIPFAPRQTLENGVEFRIGLFLDGKLPAVCGERGDHNNFLRTIQKMKDEVKNIKHGDLVQTSILKYFSSS
ncbi:hypothetical protein Dsin_018592 [Dipteronia sinensis]|uniref:RNase H type-1 domain-containing protein n=1 Tax=Dipteronia sinensis TaxID=43782 RepID=A0AAE0A5S6_9ROSI|nr:hypothetical protein Dsin_018592 [Dipteronia sinensis]